MSWLSPKQILEIWPKIKQTFRHPSRDILRIFTRLYAPNRENHVTPADILKAFYEEKVLKSDDFQTLSNLIETNNLVAKYMDSEADLTDKNEHRKEIYREIFDAIINLYATKRKSVSLTDIVLLLGKNYDDKEKLAALIREIQDRG